MSPELENTYQSAMALQGAIDQKSMQKKGLNDRSQRILELIADCEVVSNNEYLLYIYGADCPLNYAEKGEPEWYEASLEVFSQELQALTGFTQGSVKYQETQTEGNNSIQLEQAYFVSLRLTKADEFQLLTTNNSEIFFDNFRFRAKITFDMHLESNPNGLFSAEINLTGAFDPNTGEEEIEQIRCLVGKAIYDCERLMALLDISIEEETSSQMQQLKKSTSLQNLRK